MARWLPLALSGVLAAAAPAAAQPAEGGVVRKEGEYGGVNPEAPPYAPDPTAAKSKRPPAKKTLLWVGFNAKDGGSSELFFQAVEPFTVSQRVEGKTLVLVLEGLKGVARNVKRPLDTRFFDTSVARVTARKVGAKRARKGVAGHAAGVEIRIAFKDARDVREGTLRSDTGDDKMFYAYVGFGPPATPGQIPETAERPAPSMEDPEAE
jgi:hypothetical protein